MNAERSFIVTIYFESSFIWLNRCRFGRSSPGLVSGGDFGKSLNMFPLLLAKAGSVKVIYSTAATPYWLDWTFELSAVAASDFGIFLRLRIY